jgi:hypothetical protein
MKKVISLGSVTTFLFVLFTLLVVVVRVDERTTLRSRADTPDITPTEASASATPIESGQTPTSEPTGSASVTTKVDLQLLLHGLGIGGDNVSATGGGNMTPLHPEREVTIEFFDTQNKLAASKSGTVTYASDSGKFTGTIDLGNVVNGQFLIKVKSDQFLKSQVSGIQSSSESGATVLPETVLISGDINGDNTLNILDYNRIIDCFSDLVPAQSCTPSSLRAADLTDDGKVNQLDYNLFIREVSSRPGQ